MSNRNITFTDSAIKRINSLKQVKGNEKALCITVSKGGCSGLKYQVSFDEPDIMFSGKFTSVCTRSDEINPYIAFHIDYEEFFEDCKIDFIKTLSSGKFKIINNSSSHICRCGSSFN